MKSPQEQGSALLITIFFITIITLVSVGFMSTARVERASSHSHLERMRAADFARTGIEQSIGTLRKETGYRFKLAADPVNNLPERYYFRNYVTQPGALIVPEEPSKATPDSSSQALITHVKPLSTGLPTNPELIHANPVYNPPSLNIPLFSLNNGEKTYLITDRLDASGKPPEMKLKWVYIRQDKHGKPTTPFAWTEEVAPVDTNDEPIIDAAKPIVGRYAYWTDDESTKINYNLAWRRGAGNISRASHPSRVNLTALTKSRTDNTLLSEPMADSLHNWTLNKRFFNSFADAREIAKDPVNAGIPPFLSFNKFELTHYNHDPDTTFFGEDRILLTMNRDLVPKVVDPVTKKLKYTRKFLDILREDKSTALLDPGNLSDISGNQPDYAANPSGQTIVPGGNKFDIAVKNLIRYISEKNWPLSPNQSFAQKYTAGKPTQTQDANTARLGQLAVNIIDYVRSKESKQDFVAPLRFYYNTGSRVYSMGPDSYGQSNSLQGIARAPYFTEMGVWISPTPEKRLTFDANGGGQGALKDLYKCTAKFELYMPPGYQLPAGVDMAPFKGASLPAGTYAYFLRPYYIKQTPYYWVSTAGSTTGKTIAIDTSTYAVPIMATDIATDVPNDTKLFPGHWMVVTKEFYRERKYSELPTPGAGGQGQDGLRVALHYAYSGANGFMIPDLNRWPRINICPQAGVTINYTMANPANVPMASMMNSIGTNDPRCNSAVNDWKQLTVNTFGRENEGISTIGKPAPGVGAGTAVPPQQDADKDNKITDAGSFMPAPKDRAGSQNSADKDHGAVTSIGEMGYINTGADAIDGAVPFRTIRLQPNGFDNNTILPDWAFMDLFGVPNSGTTTTKEPGELYTPHGSSVGGRVNVNAHVEPYTDMIRSKALLAAVLGASSLSSPSQAGVIAQNIYDRTLAEGKNKGKPYGYPTNNFSKPKQFKYPNVPGPKDINAYDTPGEICEIKGVADTGEDSEGVIREIASLFTARGGVFGIYTVGQAIVQTPAPNPRLIVTGEQRQHTIVERYVENQGTLDTADDEVRFRSVYFENLTP